jgi:hypothetical protein
VWGHSNVRLYATMSPSSTIGTFLKCRGALSYCLILGHHLFMPHPEVLPYMFIRIFIHPWPHNSELERRNNRPKQIISHEPDFLGATWNGRWKTPSHTWWPILWCTPPQISTCHDVVPTRGRYSRNKGETPHSQLFKCKHTRKRLL